ncbi:phospho-N-acetylmuramoyl-pentapeptide-transferase [Rubritalea marina]|uniref:phospho-N-acetylmuramoyl-pentapeptide- transferase n=1 Tax=Rubritalea marina TaxID=361055 RepID=UPI00037E700F|nr:phospho-N-acetylmuramoyl-pentapeptide-transferase [Rubritalea marina]
MLYLIYEWWNEAFQSGAEWAQATSFLNLLKYITVRAGLACALTFVLSLAFGPWVIRKLISLKVGQPIRSAEEVHKLHELHGAKAGTPTMGGVLILGSVLVAVLLCGRVLNPFVAVTMFVMLGLGLLGFVDDFTKVKLKNSDGVSPRVKLSWQFGIAIVAALFLYAQPAVTGDANGAALGSDALQTVMVSTGEAESVSEEVDRYPPRGSAGYWLQVDGKAQPMSSSQLTAPIFKRPLFDMWFFAIPFFALIIIGASNAVNLTDGLDGLAAGCTITTGLAYAALAYLGGHLVLGFDYLHIAYHPMLSELAVVMLALVGASFGFLWFNSHPAKVFMGDTGSLAIGGALGTAAICTKQELLLVIIGWIFVMEALSVMIQVGSFKLRKKRVFAMAPIHHHFELRGWHESQVIVRFWIISILSAMLGLATLKII